MASLSAALSLPQDVAAMLEAGERILWVGKPLKKPFVLKPLVMIIFPAFMMALPLPILLSIGGEILHLLPVMLFFAFWYGILALIAFSPPIYNTLVWKNMYYIVTDRRIIVRKGVVGIDYDVLNLDMVQEINVDVGFWDKKYGTGTLIIKAVGVSPLMLYCVPKPLEVYKIVKRAVDEARLRSRR